jgi:hypothetical protein
MKRFTILLGLAVLLSAPVVLADVPKLINFQGILRDGSGNPVANGSYSVTFTIYDAAAGGTNLWTETQSVTTTNGLFTIRLGTVNPVPDSVFKDTLRWLGIAVSPDPEMTPRQQLVSVAYGFRISSVDGASGGTITSKVSIGPGHTNTGTNAFVAGENNAARGNYSVVGGGGGATSADSNSALGDWSTVSGGVRNTAGNVYATVGGGSLNIAGNAYATVGGGFDNEASGSLTTIGGGAFNFSSGQYAAIGGGRNHIASGDNSTVGGGYDNWATDTGATVAGGRNNRARGIYATVGGGGGATLADSNSALGQWSTVSGGSRNAAGNVFSTIGGGFRNAAAGYSATVAGGTADSASGDYSTIGGGTFNTAIGLFSTVGGGGDNLATDTATTVAGGRNNKARGRYATVGGGGGANLADSNSALGEWSTVSGGGKNVTSGSSATISGGFQNIASASWASISGGFSNIASEWGSTIGGGNVNKASEQFATVSGGARNVASNLNATVSGGVDDTASGSGSVVPGGFGNKAAGDYSFAAGLRSKAIHSGAFVWGDFTNADFASTGTNQFLIRASGGVGIGTNAPFTNLTVDGSIGYKSGTAPMMYIYESGTQNQTKRVIAHSPGFPSYGLLYNDSVDAFYFSGPYVGIGTSAPTTNLEVAGEISANTGSAATPSFTFSGDLNTGIFRPAADAVALSTAGTERMRITSSGNVGIGTTAPVYDLNVVGTGSGAHVGINKTVNDGNLINFLQDGTVEGFIGVVGTTVSYNAFTGSHYGWTEEQLERGELVSLTGVNRNSHDNPKSEIIYGIRRSSVPNDPACLGSYLALSESSKPYSSENPHLIMAVGNGDMWVVDEGRNIQPGDYLISSSTPGHAMRDDETKYPIGHIVARAAEGVDWSSVSEIVGGRKHKKISVLFGNFVRGDSRVTETVKEQQQTIAELRSEVGDLKELMEKLLSTGRENVIQPASQEIGLEK